MKTPSDANDRRHERAQAHWARRVIDSLLSSGACEFVISPGSRSTPLVLALESAGDRAQIYTVIDERSAAFFALGRARISGRPAVLICTSGSAPAHYFPAILEASEAGIPMLIISADRPLELQACRAPQTVDQLKLFGDHVRAFFELGTAEQTPAAMRALSRKCAQAFHLARGPHPGPVHLNFRARKPLEVSAREEVESSFAETPSVITGVASVSSSALAPLRTALINAQRPVLVVGPAAPYCAVSATAVSEFAAAWHLPVVAEPASNAMGVPERFRTFDLVARCGIADITPDFILQLGEAPTSGAWARLTADVPVAVVAQNTWPAPHSSARWFVRADAAQVLRQLGAPEPGERADGWSSHVSTIDRLARSLIDARLDSGRPWDELSAVATVLSAVQHDTTLTIGNSLSIRILDTATRDEVYTCCSQRGLNGIDGLVAGSIGAQMNHVGQGVLMLGDVSLLHDAGSLQLLTNTDLPLCIVVLNNGGGQIFAHLPMRSLRDSVHFERWSTPHSAAARDVAAAFGLKVARCDDHGQLKQALSAFYAKPSPTLLEVCLPPDGAYLMYEALVRALSAQLTALEGYSPPRLHQEYELTRE